MCYSPSAKDMAELAFEGEQTGDLGWLDYIEHCEPSAHAIYLELKRDKAFQAGAVAALAAGWPADEDLAGLVG